MTIDKATLDTLGFIMTVGGIVLSIVALVLSILFYAWADKQAKASDKSLVELRAATDGLSQVVKTLRDESFSLLKSAYTDMGEIAKFGVQRESPDHRSMEASTAVEPQALSGLEPTGVDEERSEADRSAVTSRASDEALQEAVHRYGMTMMKQRGADFTRAVKDAQRRIREAIADLPSGAQISTEKIIEELAKVGFDENEVLYTLSLMAQMQRLEDD